VTRSIEVGYRAGVTDARGEGVARRIREFLHIGVSRVRTRAIYFLRLPLSDEQARRAAEELFCDPVIQEYALDCSLQGPAFDCSITVGFRPGVTDNVGRTATAALEEVLGVRYGREEGVSTAVQYLLSGVQRAQAERIASELLYNPLIEEAVIQDYDDWRERGIGLPAAAAFAISRPSVGTQTPAPRFARDADGCGYTQALPSSRTSAPMREPEVSAMAPADQAGGAGGCGGENRPAPPQARTVCLEVPDERLAAISAERVLALSLAEMKAVRDYFRRPEVRARRLEVGLGDDPTDVELEAIAQTWSEHCHHKVFGGVIHYEDEHGNRRTIHSLFKSYIRRVTEELARPWLLSVFSDNAGVIRFNDRQALVYKVETHNSPSALDPYGGAMTGIVGVNRDPFGTGMGARLIANVWGYCLGNPFMSGALPKGLLHPRRIRDGVHRGVIEGGNQSGIPYQRGWELFEDRFLGKPLVFCGTLGEMPLEIAAPDGRRVPAHRKEVKPGDAIVMVGGRVGKDGIHGATFSSEELHAASPVQAVQIGDPITQKKMTDMLLEARDRLLYRALTDNGAGGLSSSVGEMAGLAGGCELDLAQVPLKYPGLEPWEILVSEAQERMTLAVPPENLPEYLALSARRRVESTPLGRFTASGMFHVRCGERTVAWLDMEFLHHGDPPYELKARFVPKRYEEPEVRIRHHGAVLKAMLGRLNLCSREEKCRQYDHEVKGRSVVKPFVGVSSDVPSDASILLAGHGGLEGIVLSEGINPFYSDIDTYWMAASAVDEAVRRVAAAGGELDTIAALDNFCWPNVVKERMPQRSHKLAQLVRANEGLYDFCRAYGVPLISGKDSMSNDSTLTDPPISIPPTLLVSVVGRIADVRRAVTLDPKAPGDLLYILGRTEEELGGSEFYRWYGESTRGQAFIGNRVPRVDAGRALQLYRAVSRAIGQGLVRSAHTPGLGGAAAALARMAFAGGRGLEVDLRRFPGGAAADHARLYSESNSRFLVTVHPAAAGRFEDGLKGLPFARIGRVRRDRRLVVTGMSGGVILRERLEPLKREWQAPLKGM
jgi:phosphoribosylformylglycinamidine synthase